MKILVVDDDPLNRKLLRAILAAEGHSVVEAEDGLVALETLQRDQIDAVISDVLMPRMDGYRLCYEVRKSETLSAIPFIIYTATYTSPSDEKVGLDFGADKFIVKPAQPEVIIKALYEVVESTRGRRAPELKQPQELLAMREYSEALVRKLEDKNVELTDANKALAEGESHLRTILDSEPVCVKIINRDGELVDMNRAGLQMFEADFTEQLVGKSVYPLIVPEYQQAFREVTEAVFRGESRTLEFEIVGLKGTRRWLETHAVPFKNANGEITSSLGITRDITESKRAEEVLRQIPLEKVRRRTARIVKDLGILFVLSVVVFVAAEHFHLFEMVSPWLLTHPETELDDLVLVLVCLAFAFAFFSYRRWTELKTEMVGRTKAEEALRVLHGELEVRIQERTAGLAKSNEALRTEIAERKQAQEMVQRNLKRIRALHEIDLAITSSLDLHTVLNVLLGKVVLFFSHDMAATIRLMDKQRGQMVRVLCHNLDEKDWKSRADVPGRVSAEVFQTRSPAIVRNVQTDPRTADPDFFRKHGLVSYLGAPMTVQDEILGVLGLYSKGEHEFSAEEVEFLTTLAGQAAIAVHNAQLFEEIKRSKSELESTNQRLEKTQKELSGFYTALSPLAPTESVNQLMDAIIERLMETTGADAALIRLQNKEGGFDWATQRGFPDYYLKVAGTGPGSALEWVFNTGQPILAPDIASDPRLKGKVQLEAGLRSCAMLPLKIGNEPRGILHLASRQLDYFNEGQKEQLMAIARQMGIALENREHYDTLRASRDELAKAVKIKDEFLSVMSHELRTPLNVVMGYTTMVKDGIFGEINPKQEKALQKVMDRARDQLAMVTSILQATQLEAGTAKAEFSEVELGNVLDEIRSSFDVLPDKEITLHWDYPSDLPVVKSDREKLRHILQNLIHNAIKFTDKGYATVSVRYVHGAERVEFKVVDTGIGIPKGKIPMIFEMFHQIDSSETRLHEGVGLGLYIVKKYTELLRGTVEVESKPDNGSTFIVTIPCESKRDGNNRGPIVESDGTT